MVKLDFALLEGDKVGRKATVIYAYLIPFVGYLLGTTFVSGLPIEYYPYAYSLLVVVLSITTYLLLRGRSIVRPHWGIADGVIVGLVGIAAWIVISDLQLEAKIGEYLPADVAARGANCLQPL